MGDKSWKRAERLAAAEFGTKRRPLSGSNSGGGSDDVIHSDLYIEVKYRQRHSVLTLFQEVKQKAIKEGKTPVVILKEKRTHGMFLCFCTTDLPKILSSWAKSNGLGDIEVDIQLHDSTSVEGLLSAVEQLPKVPPTPKPKKRLSR